MSKDTVPPQVKDEDKRTKVFDWRVPIKVGARPAALAGTLFWQPASRRGVPTAAIVALVVLVLATLVLFLITTAAARAAARNARSGLVNARGEMWPQSGFIGLLLPLMGRGVG